MINVQKITNSLFDIFHSIISIDSYEWEQTYKKITPSDISFTKQFIELIGEKISDTACEFDYKHLEIDEMHDFLTKLYISLELINAFQKWVTITYKEKQTTVLIKLRRSYKKYDIYDVIENIRKNTILCIEILSKSLDDITNEQINHEK